MLPSYCDSATLSTAEREVFDLLKYAPGTAGWTVIHSLGLVNRGQKPYGEIDFVVLIPGAGVLCLEVKGGLISCKDGVWTSTNRNGKVFNLHRSPFMQAMDGMHEVRRAIQQKFGFSHGASTAVYGRGVIFPDTVFSVSPFEWEPWECVDRSALQRSISDSLLRMVKGHRKKLGIPNSNQEPTAETIRQIKQFLRPDFEPVVMRSAQLDDSESRLDRLTEEQYDALDLMSDNKRCLFEGGAGTGKTLLALEYARRSASSGQRTLMLCFNKLLGSWLRRQAADLPNGDLITVGVYYDLLHECILTSSYGREFAGKVKQASESERYATLYPFYGQLAVEQKTQPYDVVVVDEAQDLMSASHLDVMGSWIKGGLSDGHWAMFGDFECQAIFSSTTRDELLSPLGERASFARGRLRQNCRNTRNIGEAAAKLTGFAAPPYRLNQTDGPPVEYHKCGASMPQSRKLGEVIRKILEDGVKAEDIVILSRLRFENSVITDADWGGDFRIVPISEPIPGNARLPTIRFSTIHAFKGMESRVVVMCDVEKKPSEKTKALLYVGMSRAKCLLIVLQNG